MIRAYALGMGAGTQVFTALLWAGLQIEEDPAARFGRMILGWLINVAVAEWVIHRRPARRRASARETVAVEA